MTALNNSEVQNIPALIKAAEGADAASLEELLAASPDVNVATSNGMTALMCAAANGHDKIVSVLLTRGADINTAMNEGVTALTFAAYFGHHQMVREFIARGANVTAIGKFGASPEIWASTHGFTEVTEMLRGVQAKKMYDETNGTNEDISGGDADLDSFPHLALSETSEPEFYVHPDSVAEPGWFDIPESAEVSPASLWAPDDEDEITLISKPDALKLSRALAVSEVQQPDMTETQTHARLLDETEILPGEASFETVMLGQQLIMAENPVRQPRLLDESAILPGEASFETVMLGQQSIMAENPVQQPRLLDESAIRPGEASFATVMLDQSVAPNRYSPITEFLTKFPLKRRLAVTTLLVVLSSATATLAFLNIATLRSIFASAPSTTLGSETPAQDSKVTSRAETVISSKPLATSAGSEEEKQATVSMPLPTMKGGEFTSTVETRIDPAATSSSAKGAKLNTASGSKSGASGKAPLENNMSQRRRSPTNDKKPVATNKAERAPTAYPKNSSSPTMKRTTTEELSMSAEGRKSQSAVESRPTAVTGGSQRPRRVSPGIDSP